MFPCRCLCSQDTHLQEKLQMFTQVWRLGLPAASSGNHISLAIPDPAHCDVLLSPEWMRGFGDIIEGLTMFEIKLGWRGNSAQVANPSDAQCYVQTQFIQLLLYLKFIESTGVIEKKYEQFTQTGMICLFSFIFLFFCGFSLLSYFHFSTRKDN